MILEAVRLNQADERDATYVLVRIRPVFIVSRARWASCQRG